MNPLIPLTCQGPGGGGWPEAGKAPESGVGVRTVGGLFCGFDFHPPTPPPGLKGNCWARILSSRGGVASGRVGPARALTSSSWGDVDVTSTVESMMMLFTFVGPPTGDSQPPNGLRRGGQHLEVSDL